MKELRGNIVFDSSALIEYFMGTEVGEVIKRYFETLKPEERVSCSILTISELFYVLCRLKGARFAEGKVNELLKSQTLQICSTAELAVRTGNIKCERAMSLADCSCIAAAEMTNAKAVFARKEGELIKEMERTPFGVEIVFLEEYVDSK